MTWEVLSISLLVSKRISKKRTVSRWRCCQCFSVVLMKRIEFTMFPVSWFNALRRWSYLYGIGEMLRSFPWFRKTSHFTFRRMYCNTLFESCSLCQNSFLGSLANMDAIEFVEDAWDFFFKCRVGVIANLKNHIHHRQNFFWGEFKNEMMRCTFFEGKQLTEMCKLCHLDSFTREVGPVLCSCPIEIPRTPSSRRGWFIRCNHPKESILIHLKGFVDGKTNS